MDAGAYIEVTDPSVYVKFLLTSNTSDDNDTSNVPVYLLAWTTTPWTLPANSALAVNTKVEYSEVELELGLVLGGGVNVPEQGDGGDEQGIVGQGGKELRRQNNVKAAIHQGSLVMGQGAFISRKCRPVMPWVPNPLSARGFAGGATFGR